MTAITRQRLLRLSLPCAELLEEPEPNIVGFPLIQPSIVAIPVTSHAALRLLKEPGILSKKLAISGRVHGWQVFLDDIENLSNVLAA